LARLNGEEKASLWSDIYGIAAVAFHTFTGHTPADIEQTESSYQQHLAAVGVPSGVANIIVKGLRHKDSKYGKEQDDPRLFRSAHEMASALLVWRKNRERRIRRLRLFVYTLVIAVPLLILNRWMFVKYQSLKYTAQQQTISSLQQEVAGLMNASHPAVAKRLQENDALLAELHQAEQAQNFEKSRAAQVKLIEALRETLAISRGLEKFVPLRESLGLTLLKWHWIMASPQIAAEKSRLERLYQSLGEQLDRGELDSVGTALADLLRDLGTLTAKNNAAVAAAAARKQFQQEQDGVTERVRKLNGFQPIATLAESAEQAWSSGDSGQAESLFGQARQKLTSALLLLETDDERSVRTAGQATRLREDNDSLRQQLMAVSNERDQKDTRVRELESQITQISAQSSKDRDSHLRRMASYPKIIRSSALKKMNLQSETAISPIKTMS
jgi:hypothetical protein